MKKLLIALLVLALLCSAFVACGGDKETEAGSESGTVDTGSESGKTETGKTETNPLIDEPEDTSVLTVGEDKDNRFGELN